MKTSVCVTGGASGIGLALVQLHGKKGHTVAMVDMDKETVTIAQSLASQGMDVKGYICDVTVEDEVHKTIERVIQECGDINLLYNNAGITQRSPFLETSLETYRKVMEINFFGAVSVAQAAIKSLMKTRGTMVITSSVAGIAPLAERTGYAASKHALHGFFESLSAEMIPYGVHVSLICPSFVATNLQQRALGGDGTPAVHSRSMVGKEVSPADLAFLIYKKVEKKSYRYVHSALGKASLILNSLCPGLYQKVMYRSLVK